MLIVEGVLKVGSQMGGARWSILQPHEHVGSEKGETAVCVGAGPTKICNHQADSFENFISAYGTEFRELGNRMTPESSPRCCVHCLVDTSSALVRLS